MVYLFMCLRKQLKRTSQHWVYFIYSSDFPDISKFHLKQKSSIKQSFEIIYSFMVVKYRNIILLMETLINGTCYKVSTDVLYRLGFLHHTNLPVYVSDPNKCPRLWKRMAGRARPCSQGILIRKIWQPESFWKHTLPARKKQNYLN